MSRKVALNFAILPFRRCKRPCEADVVVTGGVLLSVIYSYAARARRNELRSNHRRKRDALTVKSAAVLCCAPKWIPASFSHKRAITFERLCTGTKVFLCPPARILMTSLPICPALFAVIRVRSAPPVPRLPRRRRCLFSARREDADGCSQHAAKTLMAIPRLPRRRRCLFTICPLRPAMTWMPGCAPAPYLDAVGARLYARSHLDVICACPHICVCSGAIAIPGMPAFAPIRSSAHPLPSH